MKKRLILSAAIFLASAALPSLALANSATFSQAPFTDVKKTSAAYKAVEYLRTNNVLKGYLDGKFRPTQRITRAEFVMLMTNPFILPGQQGNDCVRKNVGTGSLTVFFSDVPADASFANAVCIGKMDDLVNGYPDGRFRPGATISFVETAKITAKVFALDVRRDNPVDDKWYVAYVRALVSAKAVPPTIKRFDQPMTRAEMAQIVYRLKAKSDLANFASYEQLK